MPPHPITAVVAPGHTLAMLKTAPAPVITAHPSSEAEVMGILSETGKVAMASTPIRSAYIPRPMGTSTGEPSEARVTSGARGEESRHRLGSFRRHIEHAPHCTRQPVATRSPTFRWVTPAPTSSTTPAPSWPNSMG